MTVQLAYELRDSAIKVNAVHPGFTATDMNGHQGTQTVEEGAAEAVRLAHLTSDGPTGGFTRQVRTSRAEHILRAVVTRSDDRNRNVTNGVRNHSGNR